MPELFQRDDVWHVVIWVGEAYYPNVHDFIEEVRVAGASRRIPKTFDFSKLTDLSRMYFVHTSAHVTLLSEPPNTVVQLDPLCPKEIHGQKVDVTTVPTRVYAEATAGEVCLGLAKYVQSQIPHEYSESAPDPDDLTKQRTLPCGRSYRLPHRPPGILLPTKPALFMQLPISGIACVRKEDGTFDQDVKARVAQAKVDVYETDA